MAFFENFGKKVGDLAQTAAHKSKNLAEIAKLSYANSTEEDTIKKAYIEIGKLYYEQYGADAPIPYSDWCGRINEAKTNISENNKKIALIKADAPDEEPIIASDEPVENPDVPEEKTDIT